MAADHILYEQDGPVAIVTFNRPEQRNAMNSAMYRNLVAICDRVDADPSVRAVIFQGAGDKAFVSGTDINEFPDFKGEWAAGIQYEARADAIMERLEAVRKPTIATVRGFAVGGGALIALCCDIRIAADNARFCVPCAKLGNCLSMQNYSRLVDLVGPARTIELMYSGRMVEAAEALQIGLVHEVQPVAETYARALATAREYAAMAPLALWASKEALRRIRAHRRLLDPAPDIIRAVYTSDDFQEGVHAFLDKRPPAWQGR